MSATLKIKGGRVIDPGHLEKTADILIENGRIKEVGASIPDAPDQRVIDARGKIAAPGLIDMHTHLREPGHEYKETIETGCRAAAAGGFTTLCCMPNTRPTNDNRQITEFVIKRAKEAGLARVLPVAAVSEYLSGKNLTEFYDLKEAGAAAVSDDGMPVSDAMLMRRALEYAKGADFFVISHCEDRALSGEGVMNEGPAATALGLSGIPNASESVMVMRDIALAELTGAHVHIAHVSARESVAAIRRAKKQGIQVTAETAPHYFTLTDADVGEYDPNAKMSPPLRSAADRDAIIQGLADGAIDVIATDHAPHSSLEKDLEFDRAANGVIGLETSLALGLGLVRRGFLTLPELIEKMAKNPAKILGIENDLKPGAMADIVLIDPDKTWVIDPGAFFSKSRNTPFRGMSVTGKAVLTVFGGKIVFDELSGRS
ncbi:Dihydroorotase [Candidatus Desulfarcum epimagneticum]|uniref:Dihydroorotase n=1 Tax=uncultured Desulfobacteraceae bacterium TaxID=218296 RepID=A0A484HCU1_9BACT|nr:Dihydroorotase [uncultured Desulfobacteraceae bacterium]